MKSLDSRRTRLVYPGRKRPVVRCVLVRYVASTSLLSKRFAVIIFTTEGVDSGRPTFSVDRCTELRSAPVMTSPITADFGRRMPEKVGFRVGFKSLMLIADFRIDIVLCPDKLYS